MRVGLAIVLAIALGSVAALMAQQTPVRDVRRYSPPGTGVVGGVVVVDDASRPPIRRAIVTLVRAGIEDMRSTSTDEAGRFSFTDLPAGTYTLSAAKGGFITMSAGAAKPGMPGRQIVVRDGDNVRIAPIALVRGAVIAGRVLDASGQPVPAAQVQVSRFVTVGGERRPRVGGGRTSSTTTNDHGEYRIFGLVAGEYVVAAWQMGQSWMWQTDVTAADIAFAQRAPGTSGAPPAAARPFALAPTLYPSTVDESSATPVAVAAGEERLGVDISLHRVPVARVSGVVVGMDGTPLGGVPVDRAVRKSPAFLHVYGTSVRTAADGSFALTGVPPGDYVLRARGSFGVPASASPEAIRLGLASAATGAVNQWAATDVSVSGADINGVSVRMQAGMTVAGQIATMPGATRVDVSGVYLELRPVDAGPVLRRLQARPDAQTGFRFEGVVPGRYRLAVSDTPASHHSQSAMLGDVDVLDTPFEVRPGGDVSGIVVTLTDVRTSLGGRLTGADGQPASHLYVLAFSQNRAHWLPNSRRIASVRAGEDGSYALVGLPPGDYFLCALTDIDTTLQYEPAYLDDLIPASIRLPLTEGEKKVQHLRAGG